VSLGIKVSDYVKTYKLPSNFCSQALDFISNIDSWRSHNWTNESLGYTRLTSRDKKEEPLMHVSKDAPLFTDVTASLLEKYYSDFPHSVCSRFTLPKFIKYTKGMSMKDHTDNITAIFNSYSQHDPKGVPVLSIVGVLKSAKKGGQFFINYQDGSREEFLTDDGSVVIFPSNFIYRHEVSEILEGERISFSSWTHF
tara:strand:+ start:983 stop:1570 length:588 start_codon:yes stop_codon:yes gene_type:complete